MTTVIRGVVCGGRKGSGKARRELWWAPGLRQERSGAAPPRDARMVGAGSREGQDRPGGSATSVRGQVLPGAGAGVRAG